ncbi:MAG: type I glutamate--ammonia ligase [Chloroflexi bacterium RBG_16_58_8]|nr:MAG: type I glutamate--ammonia ligase [Chloroflexi bacterium RBG_16_58_8]
MTETTAIEKAIKLAKTKGCQFVDLKFIDLPGLWQHYTLPISELNASLFEEGNGFDGSSIRGFRKIHESDMLLIPDPATAVLDPIMEVPTLSLVCDVRDPVTGEDYSRDPRHVAKKAEAYLKSTGIATTSYWGPELEFFIFNSVRFDQTSHSGYYEIDSAEGIWNSGNSQGPNLGYRPRPKEGYFPVPPTDQIHNLRSKMALKMMEAGLDVEKHHHEVATAGQVEFGLRFNTLTRMADNVMMYKYVAKNVARQNGYTVTFMPKPLFQDNGSGMHVHQSLWNNSTNTFYDAAGYALLSQTAKYYIGGLLAHSPALLAFCAPTTNSYRRLVPGYEAPINLVYSQRNRSASIRIPLYSTNPKTKRLEYRCPDSSCNPYLAFAAMLMAGLDGIQNKIDPGEPIDEDIYELPPEEKAKIKSTPGSLLEVLEALSKDYDFLLKGDVFTTDLLETWSNYKKKNEYDAIALRPHPYEFYLYYDI